MPTFAERLTKKIHELGPLCIGLDPSLPTLAACNLPNTAEGAFAFSKLILEASDGKLSIIKPQSAFFERFGSAGWEALERTIALARSFGTMVLLDVKRGDIDTTAEGYAQAFFTPGSASAVDAVTLHAYLGFGALKLLLDYTVANSGGVFVVVRSSNPEGEALQLARMANGKTVASDLAFSISKYNMERSPVGLGPVGAVVGATCSDANGIVQMMPQSFILAPGIGAQGATISDLLTRMPHARGRVLPSVSRGVLSKGTSIDAIRSAIGDLNEQAIKALCD